MTLVEAIAAVVCEPGVHTTDPVVLSATLQVLCTTGWHMLLSYEVLSQHVLSHKLLSHVAVVCCCHMLPSHVAAARHRLMLLSHLAVSCWCHMLLSYVELSQVAVSDCCHMLPAHVAVTCCCHVMMHVNR